MSASYGRLTQDQGGSLLLFTVIMLAVMFVMAFVIATLILQEISLARVYDDSLVSFYAGESGWEKSMDIVGEMRKYDQPLADAILFMETVSPEASPVQLAASGGEFYVDAAETKSTTSLLKVPVFFGSGAQVELFDPDDPFTFMNAESMQLYWNDPSCGGGSRMELTFYKFDANTFSAIDDSVYKQVYTCGVEVPPAGYDCQATSNWPAPNTNYIVRIKPLDCTMLGVDMRFFDADNGGGSVVEVPSRVVIETIGSARQSARRFHVETKWVPSAAGLVDYVLFSEEAVVK